MNVATIGRGFSALAKVASTGAQKVGQKAVSVFGAKAPVAVQKAATAIPRASEVAKLIEKWQAFPKLKQALINGTLAKVPAGQRLQYVQDLFAKKFASVISRVAKGGIPAEEYSKLVKSFNSEVEKAAFKKAVEKFTGGEIYRHGLKNSETIERVVQFMGDVTYGIVK